LSPICEQAAYLYPVPPVGQRQSVTMRWGGNLAARILEPYRGRLNRIQSTQG